MSRGTTGRPERTGLVLAGGRSTRFDGSDKALAELAGAPLVSHAAAALAPVVDELVVNCRADQRDALASALDGLDGEGERPGGGRTPSPDGVRFAVDPVPDEGPVDGLRTGLRVARGRHVAVVGCDQPFLRTPTVATLFDRAEGSGPDGTGEDGAARAAAGAAPLVDGRRQPLGAVYPTAAASEAAERTLAAGAGALRDVLARVDPVAVPVAPGVVRDIDTRSDLSDVSAELSENEEHTSDTMEIIDEFAVRTTNGTTTATGTAAERAPRPADGSTGGGS